jgi:branched-chain amino acid transport system permease protein
LSRLVSKHLKSIAFVATLLGLGIFPILNQSPFYLDLIIMMIVYAVMSMTFLILLRTGLISLGLAVFWGIGAYASTVLVMKLGLSFWIGLPAGALASGLFAFVIGPLLIKNAGITFLLLNAVLGLLFVVVIGNIPYLGGYTGINNIPAPDPVSLPFLPTIEFVSKVPFYYLALFLLLAVVVLITAFNACWVGRAWTAIGLKPRLAETVGISVYRYRLLSFVFASAIGGLMGSFYAHYQGFIQPSVFNMWITNYFQLFAILGGIEHVIAGPLVGAAIMRFFPELIRYSPEIGNIITGTLLIVLIIFLPRGVLSLFDKNRKFAEGITFIRAWTKRLFKTGDKVDTT